MSSPTSSATIELPAARIDDEIRKLLEEEGVRFKPQAFDPSLELDSPAYDLETEVSEEGIFRLNNPEARYGEFYDLEELLVQKDIPFDRASGMDWNRESGIRVFRPGDPPTDVWIGDLETGGLSRIREILKRKPEESNKEVGLIAYQKIMEIMSYLDEVLPTYPPLADYVKED